jgi:general secretion pathway protein K
MKIKKSIIASPHPIPVPSRWRRFKVSPLLRDRKSPKIPLSKGMRIIKLTDKCPPSTCGRCLGGGVDELLKALKSRLASQGGIALLMVLWVLTLLMVIVFSFSFMARTETYSTLSFKEGIQKKFLAEAGIERGIMELFYRNIYKNQTIVMEGTEVWRTDGTVYSTQFGDGYYTVTITDESGKVDINTVSDVVLKNLLINWGIQEDEVDIIVDSIMDWKDPDDLHRLHGAESDYYMSLPNPYKAKDANFDALEELLLVKGMTSEILYGNNEKRGIINFLTINSGTNRININAAPKEVLIAVPGMTPEFADTIIDYRKTTDIVNLQEIGIIGENYNLMAPYISTAESNTFTIEAAGYKGLEKGGYAIRATVTITGNNSYKYVYYKSPISINQ